MDVTVTECKELPHLEVIRGSTDHAGKQYSTKHGPQDRKVLMSARSTVLHIATHSKYSKKISVCSLAVVPSTVHCLSRET